MLHGKGTVKITQAAVAQNDIEQTDLSLNNSYTTSSEYYVGVIATVKS